MEWNEYINQLLSQESSFDGISLSMGDTTRPIEIPPMIKSSILMLDKMVENQGRFNILVFPERIQSIFIFTLTKLLYNISEGRIDCNYDPEAFHAGDKLRLGKAVVEFMRIEDYKHQKFMRIKLADLEEMAPIDYFPLFQKTNAKRISRYSVFAEAKNEAEKMIAHITANEKHLKLLADYKTHMDSSIINMTSIINTKELVSQCELCGQKLKDIILIGQADYEGNVRNIGTGQLGGIPAIVLASDLYTIVETANQGHPIQSIIIDASNTNALLSQIDALDELMRLGVPITCLTDVVDSFDLQPFLDRKFNLWRWDETSITDKLYDISTLASDQKAKYCANRNLEYLISDGHEISNAIRLLSSHRGATQTLSAPMLKLFDQLYSLSFEALRQIIPFDESRLTQARVILDDCSSVLENEKKYIAPGLYEDYKSVISDLKKVYRKDYKLPKQQALEERLLKSDYRNICIVVPERSDPKAVQEYWQFWCRRKQLCSQIFVKYPAEYYPAQCGQFSTTIVTGWLKRAIMRKILYSFNTQDYTVLLYDYEKRWKNYDTEKWNKSLDSSTNRQTIEKSFTTPTLHVSTTRFAPVEPEAEDVPQQDEYSEIEVVLRENKYRHYIAGGGQKTADQTVEAIPINYVGGYLAFYQAGHKVISASKIIMSDADKIEMLQPGQLKMGDFVVVRETDRDLIREMADHILEQNGKTNMRELASKWKEALEIETLFYKDEEIYQHLQEAGCTRGYQAVHSWLHDEDVIAPQSKQDLEYISKITGNKVLKELIDKVFDAAQIVKSAHIQAGRVLSIQLRRVIVVELKKYGDIDPFNIWEPIEMQVDGIGTVRILKIIDIGTPVLVDSTDTNHLIDEE